MFIPIILKSIVALIIQGAAFKQVNMYVCVTISYMIFKLFCRYILLCCYILCRMVLSRGAVQKIIRSGRTCPHDNAPDDMFLGSTAKALDIDIVSSNLFHQVRNCF